MAVIFTTNTSKHKYTIQLIIKIEVIKLVSK